MKKFACVTVVLDGTALSPGDSYKLAPHQQDKPIAFPRSHLL